MQRKQIDLITQDLEKKMVFIVGPRQVGKTWIAKEIGKKYKNTVYLNYDNTSDKEIMRNMSWSPYAELVIFDELHKMKGWKNYLKGVYDTKSPTVKILVTGSATLRTHKKIGDSLAGRYFIHTIFPFSLSEIQSAEEESVSTSGDVLERLIERSGFPEPFLAEKIEDANRWRNLYTESMIRTDVLDFASIDDVRAMQEVFTLLRGSVGSPISYSGIARAVGISPITVRRYITILESLYLVFVIRPFTKKISRSILKEPKIYFYDTGLVTSGIGQQFENAVAVLLLKDISGRNETKGQNNILSYIRTKEGKEVDFALVNSDSVLETIIEVETSDENLSPNVSYFQEKYQMKAIQIVKNIRNDIHPNANTSIQDARRFLTGLSF